MKKYRIVRIVGFDQNSEEFITEIFEVESEVESKIEIDGVESIDYSRWEKTSLFFSTKDKAIAYLSYLKNEKNKEREVVHAEEF